jgi:membrane dipeptidase
MNETDNIISKVLLSIIFSLIVAIGFCQSYKQLHKDAIVVDGHNSILNAVEDSSWSFDNDLSGKTQSDLQRMIKAGIDIQVFSMWYDGEKPGSFTKAIRRIDTLNAWVNRNPGKMMIVRATQDLSTAIKKNKTGAIISIEGGQMIENDITKLDSFFKRDVRMMTLTNEQTLPWATSAIDETNGSSLHQPKGLNDFGKKVVRRMNELGMIIDVSHVGDQTIKDVINTTTKPIIASHSCVYNLCPTHFNLKDEQIKAIAKNGGLVMISFWPGMLDSNWTIKGRVWESQHKTEIDSITKINPDGANQFLNSKYKKEFFEMDQIPIGTLIDHIDYIVKLVGADYVGLGSSFEGMETLWQGLNGNGVLDYPQITKAMLQKGYTKKDIEKILGGNFIRVFKANVE